MNDAHLQLRRILDDVREKTGLEVRLAASGGKAYAKLSYRGEATKWYYQHDVDTKSTPC